jgi:two-component system, chemotaxis family, protein-glutamate methylesterase/glutaminase
MPGHDIIVIGSSAGGVDALTKLVNQLPANLPASIFTVLHIPARSPSFLPDILSRSGPLPAIHPADGEEITHGHIYIAPPDQHLLIERGYVRIIRGPRENRHRPAIDPTFRSAALAYGPRVVGVILTGALGDGTAGLLAIKQCGGIAVVQDPHDALYPSMPLNALANVQVDHMVPLALIGPLLMRLVSKQVEEKEVYPLSGELKKEMVLAEMNPDISSISNSSRAGTPSAFSCPECGGVLWELQNGDLLHFRCRVGHAFSVESVLDAQSEQLEAALWMALKTLEEHASLSNRMAMSMRARGQEQLAKNFEEKKLQAEQSALVIQQILRKGELPTTPETSTT